MTHNTNNSQSKKATLEVISDTLRIYQQKGVFSYGTDAVLLSAYAASFMKFSSKRVLFDLCSGTGIIGLMLLDKFRDRELSVNAVEINEDAARLSGMSADESNLADRFAVHHMNLKDVKTTFSPDTVDYVTVNPPYMTLDCGFMCDDDYKTVARHEVLCNLEDVFKSAFHLLKSGGSMFVVYRPERLSTLFAAAKSSHFEIKNMTYVHSKKEGESRLVLCHARKNGKEGLKISRPFVIYNNDGSYTQDYLYVKDKGEMRIE